MPDLPEDDEEEEQTKITGPVDPVALIRDYASRVPADISNQCWRFYQYMSTIRKTHE